MQQPPRDTPVIQPDLTPRAAETVSRGVDLRSMTAGYDVGENAGTPTDTNTVPTEYDIAVGPMTDDRDTLGQRTIDTDTGMDFGVGGGRDVGSDIGDDVVSDTG
jgi:hypothetical protein